MEELPPDSPRRVKADFPAEAGSVLGLLQNYPGPERDWVLRCIIHLSRGSADSLTSNLATANIDYRDVIYSAEYDRNDNRLYNFNNAFLDGDDA